MGAVTFTLDRRLVTALQSRLRLNWLVETGTFKGDTVAGLGDLFESIVSIELSEILWQEASARFDGKLNTRILCGESSKKIAELRSEFETQSTLYWLDAHWCVATDTAGELSQCPLLDELRSIGKLNPDSVILIDDARFFLAPPLAPHEISQWPTFYQVLAGLRALSSTHEVMVVNDVIAFYPIKAQDAINAYAQTHGYDWLIAANCLKDWPDIVKQLEEKEEVIQGMRGAMLEKDRLLDSRGSVIGKLESAIQDVKATVEDKDIIIRELTRALKFHDEDLARTEANKSAIQDLELLVRNKDMALQDKEVVIRELVRAVKAYRLAYSVLWPLRLGAPVIRRGREIVTPRLGNLNQYAPRRLTTGSKRTVGRILSSHPTMSIVTPSYGQGAFIERTLLSVLSQEYPQLEYYVQDGGSKDGTVDVLKSYEHRLTGWVSEKDGGQSQAINAGFRRTTGEIMGWLNSDDLLLPGSLQAVVDCFNRHPDVDVVYGNRLLIDENDLEIGRWILPGHDGNVLSWADYVPQETLFWRRSLWEKVDGRIDESFRFAMDWDLLVRFRSAGAKFMHIPRFLGAFRIHQHQKTSASIVAIGHDEMDRIRARIHGRIPSRVEVRKALIPYLLKHIAADMSYRVKTRLGIRT